MIKKSLEFRKVMKERLNLIRVHTFLYIFLIFLNFGYILTKPLTGYIKPELDLDEIPAQVCREVLAIFIFTELFIIVTMAIVIFFTYLSIKLSLPLDHFW